MRVLVTGATGFLGRHLARRLQAEGAEVTVLARDLGKATRVLGDGFDLVSGDLRDATSVGRAVEGVEIVYHIAARRDHWGRPYGEYFDSNVTGTENVLDAARRAKVQKILYCSSVGVHGYDFDYRPVDEAHRYGSRLNYYHKTKMLAEQIVLQSDLPAITVRPGWIYGPNDDGGGVTQMLLKLARGRFALVGSGQNRLQPVFVSDVVEGTIAAARSDRFGEVFTLTGAQATTLREFVAAMARTLRVSAPGWRIPHPLAAFSCYLLEPGWALKNRLLGRELLGDKPLMTRDSLAVVSEDQVFDIGKAQRVLGHTPRVGIEEGLRHTVDWLATTGRLPQGIADRLREASVAGELRTGS